MLPPSTGKHLPSCLSIHTTRDCRWPLSAVVSVLRGNFDNRRDHISARWHEQAIAFYEPVLQQRAQLPARLFIRGQDQLLLQFLNGNIEGRVAQAGWDSDDLHISIDAHFKQDIQHVNVGRWLLAVVAVEVPPD